MTTPRAILLSIALALSACGKKDEAEPVSAPLPLLPPAGDRLSTGIGAGRALDSDLAPSSTKWSRFVVADDRHAAFVGETGAESIFVVTADGGRSWRTLRTEAKEWWSWGLGTDGSVALATGSRDARTRPVSIPSPRVQLAAAGEPLGGAILVGARSGETGGTVPASPARARIAGEGGRPFVLGSGSVALVLEEMPRRSSVVYLGPTPLEPVRLPAGEAVSPVIAGRPPALVSVRGRDVLVRPLPAPGEDLAAPVRVDGLVAGIATIAELSGPPICETGELSYFALTQPRTKEGGSLALLGVSATRSVVLRLPEGATGKPGTVGCGAARVTAWLGPPNAPGATLATCEIERGCTTAKAAPFKPWEGPHEADSRATAVGTGVIVARAARAGERWAVLLTQSTDGGSFELPRVVAEGTGDRGRIELGALASLGTRALLLLAADVTGTSRRAWYVLASDDGGATWVPP